MNKILLLFPLLEEIKPKMPDECASALCYPICGDTEENRSHSLWEGGSHLVLPPYETFEGPKDFVHFPLLFYPLMV